jgi:hypothetical protein
MKLYFLTSRLSVCCNGLQQYPYKLSAKKFNVFLLIVSAFRIIFFLILLTDVLFTPSNMSWYNTTNEVSD